MESIKPTLVSVVLLILFVCAIFVGIELTEKKTKDDNSGSLTTTTRRSVLTNETDDNFRQKRSVDKPPHIIFIVADDLGFNDVSWHNSKIIMPTMNDLATRGVILEQNYVLPVCTPSRAAFMTGIYPYKMGRQHRIIRHIEPTGLPIGLKTMPQKLKEYGYKTHLIGKWHLGYCNTSYLPTRRGFDSFFGFHTGSVGYYNPTTGQPKVRDTLATLPSFGYDFWMNEEVYKVPPDTHSSTLYSKRFDDIVSSHPDDMPLFVYASLPNVHEPLEVPESYLDMYPKETDKKRKSYLGLITNMDDIIKSMVESLMAKGLYDNSIIVFTTDNGGAKTAGADNRPLRGNKNTLFEGGTRGVAFVHSPLLKKKGYINTKLIHAVDWWPTFIHLAGGSSSDSNLDGVNQWEVISENSEPVRKEFVYNIDEKFPFRSSIRYRNWKLIWQYPEQYPLQAPSGDYIYSYEDWLRLASRPGLVLFNLDNDPFEMFNVASKFPTITESLKEKLINHMKDLVFGDDPPDSYAGKQWVSEHGYSPGWCIAK